MRKEVKQDIASSLIILGITILASLLIADYYNSDTLYIISVFGGAIIIAVIALIVVTIIAAETLLKQKDL